MKTAGKIKIRSKTFDPCDNSEVFFNSVGRHKLSHFLLPLYTTLYLSLLLGGIKFYQQLSHQSVSLLHSVLQYSFHTFSIHRYVSFIVLFEK